MGTVGNSAFPLGRSFQCELRSRCQKGKGTEFPCVPAEIKPWLNTITDGTALERSDVEKRPQSTADMQ